MLLLLARRVCALLAVLLLEGVCRLRDSHPPCRWRHGRWPPSPTIDAGGQAANRSRSRATGTASQWRGCRGMAYCRRAATARRSSCPR